MAVVGFPTFDAIYGIDEASICNRALSRVGADIIKDTDEDTKQSRLCKSIYAQTRDELLRLYPFNFATKTRNIPIDTAWSQPLEQYNYAYKAWDYVQFTGDTTTGSNVITNVSIALFDTDVGLAVSGPGIPDNTRIVSINDTLHSITIDRNATATGVTVSMNKYIPLLKVVQIGGNSNNLYELFGSGSQGRILTNISSGIIGTQHVLQMRCVEQVINPKLFDSIFVDALVLRLAIKIAISFTQSAGLISMLYQEFSQMLNVAKIASAEEKEIDPVEDWYGGYGPQSNVRKG